LAFLASVSAKIDIGLCRTDIKTVEFAKYGTPAAHNHLIGAIDSGFKDLVTLAQAFGFKFPINPECDDLGKVHPFSVTAAAQQAAAKTATPTQAAVDGVKFFYTSDLFKKAFPERNDAIAKLVLSSDIAGLQFPFTGTKHTFS
jgi:hypothetical protein